MTVALYAGSFDPITNGHLDIIKSCSEIFDTVIVAVAYNSQKTSFIPELKMNETFSILDKMIIGSDTKPEEVLMLSEFVDESKNVQSHCQI